MAATDSAAPAERMAVFEARLLPGSESTIALAVLFGSLAGGAAFDRAEEVEKVVVTAGNAVRTGRVGRARMAPAEGQSRSMAALRYVRFLPRAPLAKRDAIVKCCGVVVLLLRAGCS